MEALEVGFSPLRALWGQPGATVTVVGPHLQVNQDLFGPRLVRFEMIPDPEGGRPTVQIIEGAEAFPEVGISAQGVDVRGEAPASAQMRSDNDWLIYNLEAAEQGIAAILEQANSGAVFAAHRARRHARHERRALWAVPGLHRHHPRHHPSPDGKVVAGDFSADFGGTVMNGIIERKLGEDGIANFTAGVDHQSIWPPSCRSSTTPKP
jgi:hypothetical protein